MNYKLEKFWNHIYNNWWENIYNMNYKLEKFWNNENVEQSFQTEEYEL